MSHERLAGIGAGLPAIGPLRHRRATRTNRYTHIGDAYLSHATERAARMIERNRIARLAGFAVAFGRCAGARFSRATAYSLHDRIPGRVPRAVCRLRLVRSLVSSPDPEELSRIAWRGRQTEFGKFRGNSRSISAAASTEPSASRLNRGSAPKPELRLEHHLGFPHAAFRQSNTMTLRATSPAASAS